MPANRTINFAALIPLPRLLRHPSERSNNATTKLASYPPSTHVAPLTWTGGKANGTTEDTCIVCGTENSSGLPVGLQIPGGADQSPPRQVARGHHERSPVLRGLFTGAQIGENPHPQIPGQSGEQLLQIVALIPPVRRQPRQRREISGTRPIGVGSANFG
jgi:hypothetical protein